MIPLQTRSGLVTVNESEIRAIHPDGVVTFQHEPPVQLAGRRAIADVHRALHIARNERLAARRQR